MSTQRASAHTWIVQLGNRETVGAAKPVPVIVAVCSRCGLCRAAPVPSPRREERIDLSGTCTPAASGAASPSPSRELVVA